MAHLAGRIRGESYAGIKDIAIVGAGLGGLASAIALLQQQGFNVTVYEQSSSLAEIGAGVQLSPNAMKVLRALGLEDEFRKISFEPNRHVVRSWKSGRTVSATQMRNVYEREFGAGYFGAHRADLHKTYRNTHPDMQAVLALIDLSRRWPLADRDPIRHWARGRVTLLGDSAHATLQSLAQGAGMAIEDAGYLAALVSVASGDIASAFSQFAQDRVIRTSRVQLESRALWDVYHAEDPIYCEVRRQQYQERSAEDFYRCLAWLWKPIQMPNELRTGGQIQGR
jgi:2-polyprenyl-6-methoxyphenol hydroxylase-like FAD-dependent oxidoreductase